MIEILRESALLIAFWGIVSSAEWIVNRPLFDVAGILPASIVRLGRSYRHSMVPLLDGRPLDFLLVIRLITSIFLLVASFVSGPLLISLALCFLTITTWLLTARTMYGGDGSDQMGIIVSIATTVMALGCAIRSRDFFFAGVLLAGGQLTLSYLIAGFSKWISPVWRSGRAMPGVMTTFTYGHGFAAQFATDRTRAAKILCWTVFVGETIFPFALLLPWGPLVFVLAIFMFFHLSNAYFMGLNTFVWSFAAAYPAVLALASSARTFFHLAV